MAGVRPDLSDQHGVVAEDARSSHLDRHGEGGRGAGGDWQRLVLVGMGVAAELSQVVLAVADVGAAGVVAGPGAGVLRSRVVGLAAHRLVGGGGGALVADTHALPLPETGVDLGEGGPTVGQLVPTFHHEGVHSRRTVLGAGEQLAGADHLDHLLVGVAVVGLEIKSGFNASSPNQMEC